MSISVDEVRHVAKLARLDLDEGEIMAFQSELNALLGHFQDIVSLDVSGIEPKPHAVALKNVWAEDCASQSLSRDEALRNGPVTRAGLFIVPQIIED